MRADSAGATHDLRDFWREGRLRYSVGYELCETGLRNLPFKDFEHNRVWLMLVLIAHTSSPGPNASR